MPAKKSKGPGRKNRKRLRTRKPGSKSKLGHEKPVGFDLGRAYKFNKTVMVAILESLADGSTVTSACEKAGVTRGIFYHWLNRSAQFEKAVRHAQKSRIHVVEDASLICAVTDRDASMLRFLLKNMAPDRYKEKTELSVSEYPPIILEDAPKRKD